MIDRDLIRHAPEFKRALANHAYELTEDGGVYIPRGINGGAVGTYFYDTNGENPGESSNLLTIQAFNHILDVALRGQAAAAAFYLALFSGAYTVVETATAATWVAAATEITSNTTGYSETTRRPWTPAGAAAAGIITNVDGSTDNKAAFTIATATTVTIRGAALVSEQAKGAGTGVLISLSRFPADRVHSNADVFNLGYRVRLQNAA